MDSGHRISSRAFRPICADLSRDVPAHICCGIAPLARPDGPHQQRRHQLMHSMTSSKGRPAASRRMRAIKAINEIGTRNRIFKRLREGCARSFDSCRCTKHQRCQARPRHRTFHLFEDLRMRWQRLRAAFAERTQTLHARIASAHSARAKRMGWQRAFGCSDVPSTALTNRRHVLLNLSRNRCGLARDADRINA